MKNKYCQNCRTNTKQIFVESIWRCEECFTTHSEFLPHPESLLGEIKLAGSQIIQYHDEIARLTSRIAELEDANRWISVSERLPEKDSFNIWETYLCKLNWFGEIKIAPLWFSYGGWYTGYSSTASNYSDKVIEWKNLSN
jgi:hypothetical protein